MGTGHQKSLWITSWFMPVLWPFSLENMLLKNLLLLAICSEGLWSNLAMTYLPLTSHPSPTSHCATSDEVSSSLHCTTNGAVD